MEVPGQIRSELVELRGAGELLPEVTDTAPDAGDALLLSAQPDGCGQSASPFGRAPRQGFCHPVLCATGPRRITGYQSRGHDPLVQRPSLRSLHPVTELLVGPYGHVPGSGLVGASGQVGEEAAPGAGRELPGGALRLRDRVVLEADLHGDVGRGPAPGGGRGLLAQGYDQRPNEARPVSFKVLDAPKNCRRLGTVAADRPTPLAHGRVLIAQPKQQIAGLHGEGRRVSQRRLAAAQHAQSRFRAEGAFVDPSHFAVWIG